MIAVIFETTPRDGRKEAYLEAAARLKPLLREIDGFDRSNASRPRTARSHLIPIVLAR